MTSKTDDKLKTALDESRLLILGAQVLFGFTFEGIFQDLFKEVAPSGQIIQCAALAMLLLRIGCLIAPSLHHQIASGGDSRSASLQVATVFASMSLLPITLGLGAAVYVVFDRMFGNTIAGAIAGTLTLIALGLLYGLGAVLRRREENMPAETLPTPLKTKIEQLLTEARVMIPGGQALLGFQFIATLTKAFSELPQTIQYLHALGLIAVYLAVMLLMTPSAFHSLAYRGDGILQLYRL